MNRSEADDDCVQKTARDYRARQSRLFRGNGLLMLVSLLSLSLYGCATASFPVMGIRPDYPQFEPSQETRAWCGLKSADAITPCANFRNYLEYATNLSAAYRSRATLNEWGLYFAGLVGLSGLSTTAGLAATNAGIQALRIVPLITGFTAGATAVIENKDKALNYTKAANAIDDAIKEANEIALTNDYPKAFTILSQKVTQEKNALELTRVELAARDKQIEKIVEEQIRKRLPAPLRLSDEELTVAVGQTQPLKVEDGASVDPNKTEVTTRNVVKVEYGSNHQSIAVTGLQSGQTRIKFRDKDGISATVFVTVK